VLLVPRATFSFEDPFAIPPNCKPASLVRATDGAAPRLGTQIAAYFDDEQLTIIFTFADDVDLVATHLDHDAPLYTEDVVEVFLAPERITRYYEIEVNPLGTTFDAIIDSPDGVRATMRADLGWTCRGLFAAICRDARTDVVIRIPFASLDRDTPIEGETWRGNFYRIDRSSAHGDEFSAWKPTMKSPADFHVAAAFGELRFAR
jgi:hypothetical protein